jgi:circadian clock protein KaiC
MAQQPMSLAPEEMSAERSAGIPKAATGIRGMDEVLLGGLPRGRTTLLTGGPGTGKTVVGLEFLYRGAVAGEPGIFVTFEESADAVRRNARTLGWNLQPLERDGKLVVMHAEVPSDLVQSGDFDIGGLLGIVGGLVRSTGAQRIVIDAIDVLLRLFHDPQREQEQLIRLHAWLLAQRITAVLTVKAATDSSDVMHRLEYMTDCVIRLDHRVVGQVSTRRLRVMKYRGSAFMSNEYPYLIVQDGAVLMPISSIALASRPPGARFPTGVEGLDRLLNGGFFCGSSILIGGASGTGKTILGCSIATAASARGEHSLYISFEESIESLSSSVASAGIDLASNIAAGGLQVLTSIPEALGVEEHLWRIFQAIERFGPKHLFVDAISACQRMGSEEAAFDFLVRLLAHCKNLGITTVYLNQTDPEHTVHQVSGIGVSSLIDALLVLRQDWPAAAHERQLLVIKMRGSRHSQVWNPFQITDGGVVIADSTAPRHSVAESR